MTYSEWVRMRGCERKHRFVTEGLARNFCMLRSWADPAAPLLHPYRCEYCDDWHTTSKPLRLDAEQPTEGVA